MSRRLKPRRPVPDIKPRRKRRQTLISLTLGAIALISLTLIIWSSSPVSVATLKQNAESAEAKGNWREALESWRRLNATSAVRGTTWLAEARACLAVDLAAQAETALKKATDADPADVQPWHLWLEILRIEGRLIDAQRVGWRAYSTVESKQKSLILKDLTLALLFFDDTLHSLPDDRSLSRLERWVRADPQDVSARIALNRRVASLPRPGDPDVAAWIAYLSQIVETRPDEIMAREALIMALIDSGEIEPGRTALANWPEFARDARYFRLRGRLELEYENNPARSLVALEAALTELPQDWRTRTLLARALHALKRPADSQKQEASVGLLRELLDPANLVPRLASDFSGRDTVRGQTDLVDLCDRAGMERLANAWRREIGMILPR